MNVRRQPPIQNIPIRSDLGKKIRKALRGQPPRVLASFDYSELELCIATAATKKATR